MLLRFPGISKPGRHRLRQAAVATAVIAGHACALVLLCWQPSTQRATDAGVDGPMVLASLVSAVPHAASSAAHKTPHKTPHKKHARPAATAIGGTPEAPPPPTDPADAVPQLSDAETAALDAFQPELAEGAADQPCNLTGMLADVLAQSPAVQQALSGMPSTQRSVANAVNLWDGQWPDDSVQGGKGLLRAVLTKAVAAARPDCLTVANHGPALFFIPDNRTTVVLAVGSGDWRWGDLIAPPAVPLIADNYLGGLASRQ